MMPHEKFISEYNDQNIRDIYVFSDIHGDMEALLINLCTCAGVIRKKTSDNMIKKFYEEDEFENIMGEIGYQHTFGYEWVGNNAHIVIVGDIVDGYRNYSLTEIDEKTKTNKRIGEHPYEELKILLFLNAMNREANKESGRFIKLAGNHEIEMLYGKNNYCSEFALEIPYGGRYGRNDFFIAKYPGSEILYGDGMGIIAKIHDFVFVHSLAVK